MDRRYAHPRVTELWSLEWTYGSWLGIEMLTLDMQLDQRAIDPAAKPLLARLQNAPTDIDVEAILRIEERTQHDVAAFLEWVRSWTGPDARFLHYGLTSSDLVETAQGCRFREMRPVLSDAIHELLNRIGQRTHDTTPVLARTHGQVAESMEMRARVHAWLHNVALASTALFKAVRYMQVAKLSGPVGTYSHIPPLVEAGVANMLGLSPHGAGATQIAARQPLAAWATAAAQMIDALAKMAHDIRLMNLLGEASLAKQDGQVHSSAMAHKDNPIIAEQLAGMSAMGRGYAAMLQQQPIWLERDISNSGPERVAVPDLWHVLMHSIALATRMLDRLQVDKMGVAYRFRNAGVDPLVSELTLINIAEGMDWEDARRKAVNTKLTATPTTGHLGMVNYPIGETDAGE